MGGDDGELKWVWVAIIVLGAVFAGGAAVAVFWLLGSGHTAKDRVARALTAGGAAFLGVATLGLAVGSFMSG